MRGMPCVLSWKLTKTRNSFHEFLSIRKMKHFDAIIIGSGHNGLVTGCYLAKAGMKVGVLERRDTIGVLSAPKRCSKARKIQMVSGWMWDHPFIS